MLLLARPAAALLERIATTFAGNPIAMYKTLILGLSLLVLAAWLYAQESNPPSSADKGSGKASGLMTIEGCLLSDNDHYNLVEKDGTAHRLSGGPGKLRHYVNHQIQVAGEPGIETVDISQAGIAASAAERPVFRVKSFTEVAKTCTGP